MALTNTIIIIKTVSIYIYQAHQPWLDILMLGGSRTNIIVVPSGD